MKIIRSLEDEIFPLSASVVTIGNFDWVHLGHREIFQRLVMAAREKGWPSLVFSFIPHPMEILAPSRAPQLVSTYQEKEELIESSCVDILLCAPFTTAMAGMPAQAFLEDILLDRLGMKKLIAGYDYSFGKGREGDTAYLLKQGERLDFEVEVLKPISQGEKIFSSTAIRRLIAEGDVAGATVFLGRNFSIQGRVKDGFKRGKRLGFPTANLTPDPKIFPCPGVYAVRVELDKSLFDGVINIGYNPTYSLSEISFEVHILDFDQEIYGETLRVFFVERLRDERIFSTDRDLAEAICRDVETARSLLKNRSLMDYAASLGDGPGSGKKECHEDHD